MALSIGLVRFFIDSGNSSLLLSATASILLPVVYIVTFTRRADGLTDNRRALNGLLIGATGNTSFSGVGLLLYYFMGGRERASIALGLPISPPTQDEITLALEIVGLLWLFWMLICVVSSYVAARTARR